MFKEYTGRESNEIASVVLSEVLYHVTLLFCSLSFSIVSLLTKMYATSIIRRSTHFVKSRRFTWLQWSESPGRVGSWMYRRVPLNYSRLIANDHLVEGATGLSKADEPLQVKKPPSQQP